MTDRQQPWFHGPRERRIAAWLAGSIALLVVVVATLPRLPQDERYHAFADRRSWLGVPNAGDVVSNAPFVIAGIALLISLARRARPMRGAWFAFAIGVFATGLGSSWYHLAPDTGRLFWDRLPMTVAFMGMSAAIVGERLGERLGRAVLLPLLAVGVASVAWWRHSEMVGAGDLRWYAIVQFAPMVALPLIVALTPRRGLRGGDLAIVFVGYALSKLLEWQDAAVLGLIGVSGHTLKHLAAAAACLWVVRGLRNSLPVPSDGRSRAIQAEAATLPVGQLPPAD